MLKVRPLTSSGGSSGGFLGVTDGTNTVSNISLITLTGGANISGTGANANLSVQGLTVTDNVTTVHNVQTIQFNGGKVSGNSASVLITSGDSLISEVVTANLQSSVSFANIPNIYRDLLLVVTGRGANNATDGNALVVQLGFNGDSGANYDTVRENRFGVFNNVAGATVGVIGSLAPSNAPANKPSCVTARIFNYRDTNFYKVCQGIGESSSALPTAPLAGETAGTWWRNTSAINSVSVTLANGTVFLANCVVSLYGSL